MALKRGDTFDIEDGRTTHRLRVARGLLADRGITSTIEHSKLCAKHPTNLGVGMEDKGCWAECTTTWHPSWVSNEVFEAAADAARAIQRFKGLVGTLQINEVRHS